jgi:hypothetical protein
VLLLPPVLVACVPAEAPPMELDVPPLVVEAVSVLPEQAAKRLSPISPKQANFNIVSHNCDSALRLSKLRARLRASCERKEC